MVIEINNHLETVNNIHDISRILRDYYNYELANELDKYIEYFEGIEEDYYRY